MALFSKCRFPYVHLPQSPLNLIGGLWENSRLLFRSGKRAKKLVAGTNEFLGWGDRSVNASLVNPEDSPSAASQCGRRRKFRFRQGTESTRQCLHGCQ
jgi:hypothetical protein